MGSKKEKDYIDSLWSNNDENLLRLFFNDKIFFVNQLTLEKIKFYIQIYTHPKTPKTLPDCL